MFKILSSKTNGFGFTKQFILYKLQTYQNLCMKKKYKGDLLKYTNYFINVPDDVLHSRIRIQTAYL
jgi:hypothetical protein